VSGCVAALHGIGADSRTFGALKQALELPDMLALDMPGFAGEPGLPDSFESLKGWLGTRLPDEPSMLIGHSIGGMLALDYALDNPGRVSGLVLICTTPAFGGPDPSFKEAFLRARLSGLNAGQSMREIAPDMARGYLGDAVDPDVMSLAEEMAAGIPETTFRRVLETLVTFNRRNDLGNVSCPCLIVAGTHDQSAPPKTMAKMAERLPTARYAELDAGHGLPLECPETLASAIGDFRTEFNL